LLDASGVINLRDRELEGDFVTVREAEAELKDIQSRMKFEAAVATGKIKFDEPSAGSLRKVKMRATDIGCLQMLSPTDLKIIALGIDRKLPIVTDDYDIQNMCKELGLEFEKVSMRGIKEKKTWKKKCAACGKSYATDVSECEVCGSERFKKSCAIF
jgi:rRNA maturation endonuclease Nob1